MSEYESKATGSTFFILYMTGGVDAATGKNWCSDCDAASDLIKTKVLDKTPHPIIKGVVVQKEEWVGVSDHVFKKHPVIAAKGVPTLLLCQGA